MERHLRLFILLIATTLINGCVTVNLPKTSKGKASGVRVTPPNNDFVESKSEKADQLWKHRSTGATISYLSECSDQASDLALLETETLNTLAEQQLINQSTRTFNDREARWLEAKGKVEGISLQIAQLSFRRNGCDYILTLASRSERFELHRKDFDEFLKGFVAP